MEKNIIFAGKEHEKFFCSALAKCHCVDVYHQSLLYCLGICRDTREHINQIYDFGTGYIRPECVWDGWQTGTSEKVTRMAFNLYTDGQPSAALYDDGNSKLREMQMYAPDELFCCGYARYFWQAIQIRYPEYCEGV